MVSFKTKNRIFQIPRFRSILFLGLGGVILGGCAHQDLQSADHTCSDVTQKISNEKLDCASIASQGKTPKPGKWKTALAKTSTQTQKPLSIGKAAVSNNDLPPDNNGLILSSEPKYTGSTPTRPPATADLPDTAPRKSYRDLAAIIRHTLRDNPDIGIAFAQERDEFTSIAIARAALEPTVNVRAAFGPENYDTDSEKNLGVPRQEYSIELSQNVYDFGRTQGNIARRKALHNSAGYRRIDKMNKVSLEVAQAFMSTLEASQHITIALQNVASHEDILALVSESQKAGASSMADVKRVTTRLEKAKTNLIDLRSRKQNAREQFIRLTGLRPENLAPPPKLRAPLPPKGLSSKKYPDNPTLLAVRADIDSLRAQAKTAKANFKPSIDLDVSGNVKNNVGGETGMTTGFKGLLSFNYKLLDGDKRLNTLKQIHIRITENKHRYRKKRRNYIQSLENAIRTVRANKEKSSLLATRAKDSKKVLVLYKAQFKDGSKTVFELLDAQTDLFSTNSEKIANHYGELRSIYEIYSLRGNLVGRLLH